MRRLWCIIRESVIIQKEKRLCHGYYHVFNLISNEGGVKIIDWVDASAGDIRADACRTFSLYSQYSIELADLYLRLYCEKSGLPLDGILEWEPVIAGAMLSENATIEAQKRLVEIVSKHCPL